MATVFMVAGTEQGGAVPLPSATGFAQCKIAGTGKFSPKLKLAGTTGVTALKFKFTGSHMTAAGSLGCLSRRPCRPRRPPRSPSPA